MSSEAAAPYHTAVPQKIAPTAPRTGDDDLERQGKKSTNKKRLGEYRVSKRESQEEVAQWRSGGRFLPGSEYGQESGDLAMPVRTSGEGGEDDQNDGGNQQSIDAGPLVSEVTEEQLAWRYSHVSQITILVIGNFWYVY